MKLFLAAFIFLAATHSSAGELLRFQKDPGYEMKPTRIVITVSDSGRVIKNFTQENTTTASLIATLSDETMLKIRKKMRAVSPAAKFYDDEEGQPQCMDAPTFTYSMQLDSQKILLKREVNCHTIYLHDPAALNLVELIKNLAGVAYFN